MYKLYCLLINYEVWKLTKLLKGSIFQNEKFFNCINTSKCITYVSFIKANSRLIWAFSGVEKLFLYVLIC